MSKSQDRKPSKVVSVDPQILAVASQDPVRALSWVIVNNSGVSLDTLARLLTQIIANKDLVVLLMSVAASVVVRGRYTFILPSRQGFEKYPELVILSPRPDVPDQFNHHALHCLGHLALHVDGSSFAKDLIAKAGSSITGEGCPANEAGSINSECARAWPPGEAMRTITALQGDANVRGACTRVMKAVPKWSKEFSGMMGPAGKPEKPVETVTLWELPPKPSA
jgi:hypothetical protein